MPVHTITRAFGMDGEDSLVFRNALNTSASAVATPDQRMAAFQTVERMLFEVIALRRVEPADDVITGLIQAELELPDAVPSSAASLALGLTRNGRAATPWTSAAPLVSSTARAPAAVTIRITSA